jgi:Arc/MetJ-type ribon-helix-helix transcriptional regulator
MNITLSPELQRRIAQKVEGGEVGTAETLVKQALEFYLGYEEVETEEKEFCDKKAAIAEALEQGERGERRSAEEIFADLRARRFRSR